MQDIFSHSYSLMKFFQDARFFRWSESSALSRLYLGFWNYPFHVLCFARYYGVSMLSIVDFLCYLLSLSI